jgi:hypothetical protein
MCIIENVSFDTPLTQDGTSKAEQKLNSSQPKFSNKVQQFAMADAHREAEQKKKSFEELVPSYLHDFANIFAKDGLNKVPPEQPGIDHWIEQNLALFPKCQKFTPYQKMNGPRSRLLWMRMLRKVSFWSRSPLKQVGSFLLERRVVNFGLARIIGTSTIGL